MPEQFTYDLFTIGIPTGLNVWGIKNPEFITTHRNVAPSWYDRQLAEQTVCKFLLMSDFSPSSFNDKQPTVAVFLFLDSGNNHGLALQHKINCVTTDAFFTQFPH